MAAPATFGRRAPVRRAAPQPTSANVDALAAIIQPGAARAAPEPRPQARAESTPEELELRDWKAGRKRPMPWRQLSLMAGLSFGIGSFVLPPSVNDSVNWLLYGLMAVSFWTGLKRKKKER